MAVGVAPPFDGKSEGVLILVSVRFGGPGWETFVSFAKVTESLSLSTLPASAERNSALRKGSVFEVPAFSKNLETSGMSSILVDWCLGIVIRLALRMESAIVVFADLYAWIISVTLISNS